MEEFEKRVSESFQGEMFEVENPAAGTPNTEAAHKKRARRHHGTVEP